MTQAHTTSQSNEPKEAPSRPQQHLFITPDQKENDHQHPQDNKTQPRCKELHELVKQDQLLRAYHIAKLRNTLGYGHLSEEAAADTVDQMLSLVTLVCEMAMGQPNEDTQPDYLLVAA